MRFSPRIVPCADGSQTLFLEELKEHYHSQHGAWTESMHVYIQEGLWSLESGKKRILEVGMGTALNVLQTALYMREDQDIEMLTLEPFPLEEDIWSQLRFAEHSSKEEAIEIFRFLHQCSWNEYHRIHPRFRFQKRQEKLEDFHSIEPFDLIYFDAFAPHAQAELWQEGVMQHLVSLLRPGGRLTTYCAQGQFRRNLKAAGFKVERKPGPPGKREMTLAYLPLLEGE